MTISGIGGAQQMHFDDSQSGMVKAIKYLVQEAVDGTLDPSRVVIDGGAWHGTQIDALSHLEQKSYSVDNPIPFLKGLMQMTIGTYGFKGNDVQALMPNHNVSAIQKLIDNPPAEARGDSFHAWVTAFRTAL